MKSWWVIGVLACGVAAVLVCGCLRTVEAVLDYPDMAGLPDERIMILAPHPDDEAIACAGVIQKAVAGQMPLRIVFYTMGDNNEWSFVLYNKHPVLVPAAVRDMGLVRHGEALQAAQTLGVVLTNLVFLGYPDFGTLTIWNQYWGEVAPFRSMLTRVTQVPYTNALSPGAPHLGESILRDLETVIREFKPTRIHLSHSADHNPDHRSLYLFTRVALWNLDREGITPELLPYPVHFKNWPMPRACRPDLRLEPPAFLASGLAWYNQPLPESARTLKQQAIQCHVTQYGYSAKYLDSFVRANEIFGDYPDLDLSANTAGQSINENDDSQAEVPDALLTAEERAAWTGVETRTVRCDGTNLVVSLSFSRPLAGTITAYLQAYGYRYDRPFPEMPKLKVASSPLGVVVSDCGQVVPAADIRVERSASSISFMVPLARLGDPEYVLSNARITLGLVPVDWVAWRVLRLRAAP